MEKLIEYYKEFRMEGLKSKDAIEKAFETLVNEI